MSDQPSPNSDDLARQARRHLQSLQNAGVEFVARREMPPEPLPESAVQQENLFEESAATPAKETGATELTLEHRRQELVLLAEQVSTCSRCAELVATRKQTVFSDGQ